jgi:ABC-2 type transport system permease protein
MINDFKAVLWKEWRETILQYGSTRRWLLNMLMLIGVIGIFMPLQFGRMMIESLFLLMWMWMPLLNVITLIADSIAGERERHTLETLLASCLSDQAIVLGKITVIIVQSWLVMLAGALLALVTVNLFKRDSPELLLYPMPVAFGILVLPLLLGGLVAGIGTIASMRATTVRQAYQRMAIPLVAVVLVPSLGLSILPPDLVNRFYSVEFAQTNLGKILVIVAVALVILDTAVLFAALSRFHRSRLIAE